MRLDIARLLKEPGSSMPFDFREPMENLELGGERMDFTQPVRLWGQCRYTGKDFAVDGSIEALYTATCSRCTRDVNARLEFPLRAVFSRQTEGDDPDIYRFEGNVLDLTPMAVDELLLHIPIRHLCRPECRGLCPVCGADRNVADCGCDVPQAPDPSFAQSGGKGDNKEV